MSDKFNEYWRANFPNCLPVSYLFKKKLTHLWFRIHSLPKSKRYAENLEETQEILRRQKILFNDVIGESEDCFLFCLCYNENPAKHYETEFPHFAKLLTQESKSIDLREIEGNTDDDDGFFRTAFGMQRVSFDDLKEVFIAVADWKIAQFFILNPKLKRIFAPYDGGVDLILESSVKRDEFKNNYKDWLSSHPKGY